MPAPNCENEATSAVTQSMREGSSSTRWEELCPSRAF